MYLYKRHPTKLMNAGSVTTIIEFQNQNDAMHEFPNLSGNSVQVKSVCRQRLTRVLYSICLWCKVVNKQN